MFVVLSGYFKPPNRKGGNSVTIPTRQKMSYVTGNVYLGKPRDFC